MSDIKQELIVKHDSTKLRIHSYVYGFCLSVILTVVAYLLVVNHGIGNNAILVGVIAALALSQFAVQVYFFLHLGQETKPRWKLSLFFFMLGVVLIIVIGSLWIMDNLNTRMSIPQQIQYMNSQDGL